MKRVIPYWEKGSEWNQKSFSIHKLQSHAPIEATEIPQASLPMFSFLFLLGGEVLAEIDGKNCLIRGGHFLMIPDHMPFSIRYFKNIVGYTGSFDISFLRDANYPCLTCGKPVLHTFWFDGAAMVGELLDQIVTASVRGDDGYIIRAFDLLLYSLEFPASGKTHPIVNRFMELIFDRSVPMGSVSGYAAKLGISPSYLNKLVRTETRHSAMEWVEIARVNWAKTLLKDRERSIADISYAIGIEDPSYFSRFFRKYTRMTPSEFRKEASIRPEIQVMDLF